MSAGLGSCMNKMAFFLRQLGPYGVDYFDSFLYHALNVERCETMDGLTAAAS